MLVYRHLSAPRIPKVVGVVSKQDVGVFAGQMQALLELRKVSLPARLAFEKMVVVMLNHWDESQYTFVKPALGRMYRFDFSCYSLGFKDNYDLVLLASDSNQAYWPDHCVRAISDESSSDYQYLIDHYYPS